MDFHKLTLEQAILEVNKSCEKITCEIQYRIASKLVFNSDEISFLVTYINTIISVTGVSDWLDNDGIQHGDWYQDGIANRDCSQ